MSSQNYPIRIGCYSAFWGDSTFAAAQLIEHEGKNLDYLVADYLAGKTYIEKKKKKKRQLIYILTICRNHNGHFGCSSSTSNYDRKS